MIREFVICVDSIQMQLREYQISDQNPLGGDYGSVQIPKTYFTHNGKSMGIIVSRTPSGTFHAVDARCAHCFYDEDIPNSKLKMMGCLTMRCSVCSAEVHNFVIDGGHQMLRYDLDGGSPVYLDAYEVIVFKINKKKYLLITNPLNGLRDEWMRQPENQILLENGKPYRHPIRELNKPKFTYPHY